MVVLTLSVLNNKTITAVELQMDGKVENFYLNIFEEKTNKMTNTKQTQISDSCLT